MKKFVLELEGEFEFELEEDDVTAQDAIVRFFEELTYIGEPNRLDYKCEEVERDDT